MAKKELLKQDLKIRRKNRIRAKIFGTAACPRLSVFRSLTHIYVQLIDDSKGVTLAAASDNEIKNAKGKKTDLAFKVGEMIAEKAKKWELVKLFLIVQAINIMAGSRQSPKVPERAV